MHKMLFHLDKYLSAINCSEQCNGFDIRTMFNISMILIRIQFARAARQDRGKGKCILQIYKHSCSTMAFFPQYESIRDIREVTSGNQTKKLKKSFALPFGTDRKSICGFVGIGHRCSRTGLITSCYRIVHYNLYLQ